MKRQNERRLGDAIQNLLEEFRLKDKLYATRLQEKWGELFGPAIQKYTREVTVRNRRLYLRLDSAPLRHELSFHKTSLLEKVNACTEPGYILDVILQ